MPRSQTAHVLIVDDERHIAEMIRSLLERYGYTVVLAGSGEEALALLNDWDFDVIITDHYLDRGELCGLDLVQAVSGLGRDIPFLVATACVEDEILDGLRAHPSVQQLFRKPFDLMALKASVARAVSQRRVGGGAEMGEGASGTSTT
jgi:CheY-like chemotaxis protein